MKQRATSFVLIAFLAIACRTADSQNVVADRLFFGRDIPAGGTVSDSDWKQFVETVVTPKFPSGLTVWQGNGQWLNQRGELTREAVFVIEVLHENNPAADAAMASIAVEYKKRFGQEAVMRVTSTSKMQFY